MHAIWRANRLPGSRRAIRRGKSTVSSHEIPVLTFDGKWKLPTFVHRDDSVPSDGLPPLFLISGWTGVSSDWGALPRLLVSKTGREVITYDPRWMGQAQNIADDNELEHSIPEMVADASKIISHLSKHHYRDHTSFCLVGASMGGIIARQLLSDESERVDSLVLVSTCSNVSFSKVPQRFLDSFESWSEDDSTLQQTCALSFFEALGNSFLAQPGRMKMRDKLVKTFIESRRQFRTPPHIGIKAQRRAMLEHFESGLSQVSDYDRRPCLVLHGKEDRVFSFRNAFELQDAYGRSCEVELLPPSDHLTWITDGTAIVDMIARFLNKQKV